MLFAGEQLTGPHDRQHQIQFGFAGRGGAEDVQAVADLNVLDLTEPAVDMEQHVVEVVVLGRSASPRSWSILAERISVQICWRMAGSLAGSSAAMVACSSSSCSSRAMSP